MKDWEELWFGEFEEHIIGENLTHEEFETFIIWRKEKYGDKWPYFGGRKELGEWNQEIADRIDNKMVKYNNMIK